MSSRQSLLAIDIGNTNISFALMHGMSIAKTWRIETRKTDNNFYSEHLPASLKDKKDVDDIIISSVVPELNSTFEAVSEEFFKKRPIILSPEMDLGIKIWYRKPSQIGVDRLANACGAIKTYGVPAIVIDFGTATTFDVISHGGEYMGGVIAPGLGIARDGLYNKTSLLPWVNIMRPDTILGQDTVEAVQSGIYWGFIGLIKNILSKLNQEVFSNENVICIATGGYTSYFIHDIPEIKHFDVHLTFKGLKHIYDYLKRERQRNR